MMSFTYITDYIGSNITKICNLTGQIICNIIKISNIIYYDYDESGSIWGLSADRAANITKAAKLVRNVNVMNV